MVGLMNIHDSTFFRKKMLKLVIYSDTDVSVKLAFHVTTDVLDKQQF